MSDKGRLKVAKNKEKGEKKPVGRPRVDNGRVRFTTLVDPSLRDTIKLIALRKKTSISDCIEEAMKDFINANKEHAK